MKYLTEFELQLIEKALEMQITIYESYGNTPKSEIALGANRDLLNRIRERLNGTHSSVNAET